VWRRAVFSTGGSTTGKGWQNWQKAIFNRVSEGTLDTFLVRFRCVSVLHCHGVLVWRRAVISTGFRTTGKGWQNWQKAIFNRVLVVWCALESSSVPWCFSVAQDWLAIGYTDTCVRWDVYVGLEFVLPPWWRGPLFHRSDMYVCASCLQQTRSQREIDSRKYGDDQLAQCARGWKQVERKQDICNGAWAPALHGALARASFVWLLRSRVLL
jgi:hypothetical protein